MLDPRAVHTAYPNRSGHCMEIWRGSTEGPTNFSCRSTNCVGGIRNREARLRLCRLNMNHPPTALVLDKPKVIEHPN
jgi:hypothetical protein